MDFVEKDLEEIIYHYSQTEGGRVKLAERGLPVFGKMFRQVDLGRYGRLDLMTIDTAFGLTVTVYELKVGKINLNALSQACRYLTALRQIASSMTNRDIQYKIVLIGRQMELNGDFSLLYNFMNNASIVLYKYDLDGISFETQDKEFVLSNSGLDYSRYKLSFNDMREMVRSNDELPF